MKRILLFIIALMLVFSLVSCDLFRPSSDTKADDDDGDFPVPPSPAQTVKGDGLTFNLTADGHGYILTKADVGPTEYVVPSKIVGLPVVEIASGAFKGNTVLKKVTLPDSIEVMNQGIFDGCKNIEEMTLPYIASKAGEINSNATTCIGYYFTKGEHPTPFLDWVRSAAGSGDSRVEYWIPAKLKKLTVEGGPLGEYTFSGAALTEVNLGQGVRFVSAHVFAQKSDLERVTFATPITSVGTEAFWNCSNLKSVALTGETLWIGKDAFSNCYDLEWVVLSGGTTSIGNFAFDDCSDLAKIYYLGSVEDFANIEIGTFNEDFLQATLFIYSEAAPDEEGNFWHYDEAGNPVEW